MYQSFACVCSSSTAPRNNLQTSSSIERHRRRRHNRHDSSENRHGEDTRAESVTSTSSASKRHKKTNNSTNNHANNTYHHHHHHKRSSSSSNQKVSFNLIFIDIISTYTRTYTSVRHHSILKDICHLTNEVNGTLMRHTKRVCMCLKVSHTYRNEKKTMGGREIDLSSFFLYSSYVIRSHIENRICHT